jgi:hypothetical protein
MRAKEWVMRLRTRLSVGIFLSCLVGLAPVLASAAEPTPVQAGDAAKDKRWNEPDLLPFVSSLGGGGSPTKFDSLASVKQYEMLQTSLEKLKQMILHDAADEQEVGEGLRGILKIMSMEITDTVDSDYMNPLFARLDSRHREVGAFNPDAEYDQTRIDGQYDYAITGNLGTVRYVSMTINGTGPDGKNIIVGYMDDQDIRALADKNGDFTIWLTREKPAKAGGWIKIDNSASGVVARQYIADRHKEKMATFAVTAVGAGLPDIDRMSDDEIGFRIGKVASALLVNSTWHRTLMPYAMGKPNTFFEKSGAAIGGNVANTENLYDMAHFQVGDDEALVIDFMPPKTKFWNLTSATYWHESQHYLTLPVSLTLDEVTKRPDGSVRFILTDKDPGLPNWIRTFQHKRGFLIMRMVRVDTNPVPTITRVKFADLAKYR